MPVLDDVGGAIKEAMTINWSSFSIWIDYFFYGLIVVTILSLFWVFLQYRIKVTYYPVRGDPDGDGKVMLGRPKFDWGRMVKKKGTERFHLLLARKYIQPIKYEQMYPDGVYLLRKSNSEFQPIPRPVMGNPSVAIHVAESDMDLWASVQKQEIVKRTSDEDVQKRATIMVTTILIGTLIFAGVVLWLIFGAANQAISESVGQTDKLVSALQNLAQTGGPG